jgi:PIN like domain
LKFLIDNNLSPYLAMALAALCEPESVLVRHLRDKFNSETPDIEWIGVLATEGDWAIVSQDRLTRKSPERDALRRSGLTAFILARGWTDLREWDKAWHLRWWPRIMASANLVSGAFEVPVKFSGHGKLRQIGL